MTALLVGASVISLLLGEFNGDALLARGLRLPTDALPALSSDPAASGSTPRPVNRAA